ncbi:L,D-transpeptidase family protein [Aureimonas phyllosphaerae]|uniref:Lipoprotein-anchoring transpeptidase ErfK/SrfK n=1 Tax=Aureimonas phyllosphaerae TaxID=1166078 RepID=A0A7W6FVG9_9HYPH|nr:L,D-transpeptidase [Aureimonas phyllosphaerae]MBB3937111.1 lipoprotein-anchoring transpeptidase ErfK/SrfK [Aureimonas phyllosphaerae]MBB3961252.1 lipoprotein-anchoring transpeptidase ErfK/SrfK [Aureimonas phyllosphaerae]SFF52057.1 Lipoprotein-anchoring transpeptidase ErfK/SrfK [Aureimonas phyllosphaerae]
MAKGAVGAVALVLASLSAGVLPAAAQGYDPAYEDYGPGTESFRDEFGNIVTVDSYGRVIAVERPGDRRQRRGQRGNAPSGPVVLEGRVGEVPPADYGYGAPQNPYDDYDTYGDAPVESQPLPPPGAWDQAGLPDQGTTGSIAPGEGAAAYPNSGPRLEGQTMIESNPAPKVAGPTGKNAKIEIAALQVLLDRAGASPGVIDGRMGGNVDKAVAAYAEMTGRSIDATNAQSLMEELMATGGPAVVTYEITNEDVGGPYVAAIPEDYAHKAMLPAMSYERVTEMLAERFHMDEGYLKEINPGADFTRPGTQIKVMATGENVTGQEVAKIIADKGREQVRAYDASGRLVAAYPSSIGSTSTPSPSGTVEVARIAFDPNYTYNPKINFKQGANDKVLTIPPGPNGPVGTIWIALSKPTYGIHGTPEPSKIGKTNSHGCVRLTNWDAAELAKLVKPGVTVEFVD